MDAERPKHTPTPYFYRFRLDVGGPGGRFVVASETANRIAICSSNGLGLNEYSRLNADFIVRACNSHEALLEACKAIINERGTNGGDPDHISLNDSIWMCQHAVDKAEGRELMPRPVGGWTEEDRPR